MVAGRLLPHDVDAGAQTIDDAVHLADGHRNPVFDRLNGRGELVQCALDHAVHTRSLDVRPVGYIGYHDANLLRFAAQSGAGSGQVFGDGFQLGRDVLDQLHATT